MEYLSNVFSQSLHLIVHGLNVWFQVEDFVFPIDVVNGFGRLKVMSRDELKSN